MVVVDAPDIDASNACNNLEQSASSVTQFRVAEAAPTATGGTIPDGTYHLISDTIFTGVGGATGATGYSSALTTSCAASVCEVAIDELNGMAPTQSFDIVISGTTIAYMRTCPDDVAFSGTITTATAGGVTTVTIFEPFGADTRGRVYEQQ